MSFGSMQMTGVLLAILVVLCWAYNSFGMFHKNDANWQKKHRSDQSPPEKK